MPTILPPSSTHRDPAHLVLRHQPHRLVQVLLRVDGDDVGRGDVVRARRLGVAALGHDPDSDVSVGERADQAVAFDDRGEPHVLVAHHLGGVGHPD